MFESVQNPHTLKEAPDPSVLGSHAGDELPVSPFRPQWLRARVCGFGFRGLGLGFRVWGLGFSGLGFRV